ncbi:MAG: diguanylate cyclase [Thiohalocapsa sp.]|uniref:sensor domain-containing diguanylate cyclase n=1 Tax=Thiohalocapsa sp. TaxID=2497641 RepID=UPI0025E769AD|nr:7TM diverse intracellular signaling domain-containing protein [Thiohalocapsa sp.]MCG6940284.1 diguanylate cyclase [Thiohalocapsa sp.]
MPAPLLPVLLLLLALPTSAACALTLDGDFSHICLQPQVWLLPDPGGRLDADAALASDAWRPNIAGADSLGLGAGVLWVRLRLVPGAAAPEHVVLEVGYPMLDRVRVLLIPDRGRRLAYEAGDALPFDRRPLRITDLAFPVPLDAPVTVLLRLETTGSMQFPLSLWTPRAFSGALGNRALAQGFYYGVFAVLILLALAAYPFFRDRIFLLYGSYLLSYALMQLALNGLLYRFLFPGGGVWPSRLPPLLSGITMLMLLWFGIRFLNFWWYSRVLRWAFRAFLAASGLVVLSASVLPLAQAIPLASITGSLLLPLMLAAGVYSVRRGQVAARYFTLAWGIFLCSVSVTGLTLTGLLPSRIYTTYAMQFGSALEVVILGLALLDRVSRLRRQKDAAVAMANGYLRQLNERLESMVAARTRELEEANGRLRSLARQDGMTGLLNHRAGLELLAARLGADAAEGFATAVIMLDLDHFKQVNDTYGHQAGDRILLAVARVLLEYAGEDGVCCRYGGEEFLFARRVANATRALDLAELLRRRLHLIRHPGGPPRVTASIGVAVVGCAGVGSISPEQAVALADQALYRAKRAGRDRVEATPNDNDEDKDLRRSGNLRTVAPVPGRRHAETARSADPYRPGGGDTPGGGGRR